MSLTDPGILIGIIVVLVALLGWETVLLVRTTNVARNWALARKTPPPPAPAAGPPPREQSGEQDDFSTDPLTGLPTFQPFSECLLDEFFRLKEAGGSSAVVLIDINHLADVNQQFGVESGDAVLLHVGECLLTTKRGSDILARLGDDEFGLLLPDCDDQGARVFIERVQERLARDSITVRQGARSTQLWIGICAGMAVSDAGAREADDVLTRAVDDLIAARAARDRRRQRWERSA